MYSHGCKRLWTSAWRHNPILHGGTCWNESWPTDRASEQVCKTTAHIKLDSNHSQPLPGEEGTEVWATGIRTMKLIQGWFFSHWSEGFSSGETMLKYADFSPSAKFEVWILSRTWHLCQNCAKTFVLLLRFTSPQPSGFLLSKLLLKAGRDIM